MSISLINENPTKRLDSPTGLLGLIRQHLSWYPLMEPRDIYKLLYQGVLGAEHLNLSTQEFTSYLLEEYNQQQADHAERLLEPIRPDETLYRLNLRACKARSMKMDLLLPALLKTAKVVRGSKAELLATWEAFSELFDKGQLAEFAGEAVHRFSRWLEGADYPMVHHSQVYIRVYQPSYRLIAAQFIHRLRLDETKYNWADI